MDERFLKILRCPITNDTLELAGEELLRRATESQLNGNLTDRAGLEVEAFEVGLVDAGGRWFYPVRNDIPSLIPDQAVAVEDLSGPIETPESAETDSQ